MSFARRASACLAAFLVAAVFSPLPAHADEVGELKKEIADLRTHLNDLENRLSKQESAKMAAPASSAAGSAEIPSWVRKIQLSGFADVSFVYNPDPSKSRTNTLRVFDTNANSFQPNAFELVVEKPVSADSPVGFRTDVDLGKDAEVVGSVTTGLGSTTDEIDLQQAYAEALLPVGNGLGVKLGKFVTLHGAEVIESKDNWNFSRSFLFGYAIPFTHTGVRLSYPFASWFTGVFGVNNGWDVVSDNNGGKSLEASASITPTSQTSLGIALMTGPEQTNNNHNDRHLVDVVLGYNPTDKLGLKLNYDYGHEENVIAQGKDASWQGVAAYARYQLIDWYALALRGEYFNDADGVRTAVRTTNGVRGVRLWELTLTNEFKVYKDLITRLEYRHDHASDNVFADGGSTSNVQDTVSAEVIYPF